MATYTIREEGYDFASIEADSADEALRIAEDEYASGGDYDTSEGTVWITWYAFNDDDDCDCGQRTIEIDPPEPECSSADGRHDWQSPYEILGGCEENPGVWGNGGGVIIREVCVQCGCERETDTWAQRPDTGEQGLQSIAYHVGKYADEVSKEEIAQ